MEKKTTEEAPEAKESLYTDAQLYKHAQIMERASKEGIKRREVLVKVKEQEEAYKPEIRGSWIPYTEKNGNVSPAIVVQEKFKADGEGLSMVLTVLVFSATTSQPYRAEVTY